MVTDQVFEVGTRRRWRRAEGGGHRLQGASGATSPPASFQRSSISERDPASVPPREKWALPDGPASS